MVRNKHVKYVPAEMPAALVMATFEPDDARTGKALGFDPLVVSAVPSSLYMSPPQQYAPPESVTAHECAKPADTETAPSRGLEVDITMTSAGVRTLLPAEP